MPVVLGSLLVLGTAEMFADNTGSALFATAVPKEHLGVANSRLSGTRILANDLAGPPTRRPALGIGMAVPFGVDAICALAAAVLVGRIAVDTADRTRRRSSDATSATRSPTACAGCGITRRSGRWP